MRLLYSGSQQEGLKEENMMTNSHYQVDQI